MKYILAAALAVMLSCTDEGASRRALEAAGYTDIEFHGYSAFRCGKGDDSCTEFSATGPTGRRVRGVVGCGIGCSKGCTVRTF